MSLFVLLFPTINFLKQLLLHAKLVQNNNNNNNNRLLLFWNCAILSNHSFTTSYIIIITATIIAICYVGSNLLHTESVYKR